MNGGVALPIIVLPSSFKPVDFDILKERLRRLHEPPA
jgi:hypothetical protein